MVSADLTLRELKLQGIVSGKRPFLHFFYFPRTASLRCEGCLVEFSCGGEGTDFFNDALDLVRIT